jgi:hypothetical protein
VAVTAGMAVASPQRLYTALLTTSYRDSELPSGFFSAKVSLSKAGSAANAFGKIVKNGLTAAIVVKGSVLIAALTTSADNEDSGNVPEALALLRSGIRHLLLIDGTGR